MGTMNEMELTLTRQAQCGSIAYQLVVGKITLSKNVNKPGNPIPTLLFPHTDGPAPQLPAEHLFGQHYINRERLLVALARATERSISSSRSNFHSCM